VPRQHIDGRKGRVLHDRAAARVRKQVLIHVKSR
jgi:hypothetical protein